MFIKFLNSKWILLTVLLSLGLITRFLFIWNPPEVVFDEVHFGKFLNAYFTGEYYFDIHPPLGKLILALGAYLGGYKGGFSFERISQPYQDIPYVALRFLPNLAGALIPAAVYLMLLAFGASKRGAALAGIFLVFDNALLVQSHFILMDSFLILFGILGLTCFFASRKKGYDAKYLIFSGIFLALSFSIKWTGLAFFAIAGFLVLKDFLGRILRGNLHFIPKLAFALLVIPVLVYSLIFYIHFALLPKSGPGDAFMSQDFLSGRKNFFEKTIELNKVMYKANATLSATHPYSSKFYTWPIMVRPVYYWVKSFEDGKTARIYLLGNPILWWSMSIALFIAIFAWRPKESEQKLILYTGYIFNLLPFIVVPRVLFLYHYLAALIFSVSIGALWIEDWYSKKPTKLKFLFLVSLILIIIGSSIFFLPLSYGLALTDPQYKLRVWLKSWI